MSDEAKEPPSEYQLIGPAEDGKISDLLAGRTAKESRQRLQAAHRRMAAHGESCRSDRRWNFGELGRQDDGFA